MSSKRKSPATTPESPAGESQVPFEQALQQVEQAVQRLEGGELDLGEALDAFEWGIRHLRLCYDKLEEAERRIELITGVDAEGNPVTQPFGDELSSLEEKQAARSRRRSRNDPPLNEGGGEAMDGDGRLF